MRICVCVCVCLYVCLHVCVSVCVMSSGLNKHYIMGCFSLSYKIYMISSYVLQLPLMPLGLYAHMEGCRLIFVLKTIKTDHSV